MEYWLIVVSITTLLCLTVFRWIKLKGGLSVMGYIARVITSLTTYLFRNHLLKLEEQYKKLNSITQWRVVEGKFFGYQVKNVSIDGLAGSLLTPKKVEKKKIVLQLHGGGYEIDLPYNNLYFAKKYAKMLKDYEILTINYRVAPENKFPAALEDALKAYRWLLEMGYDPAHIVLAGDSAGGGLAMATIMYARDHGMPIPAAVIAMSPWTDLTGEAPSFTNNYQKDPVFGNSKQSIVYTSTYAEGMDKKNPYISPRYGSFASFPPMLLQVGTHEMLLSDSVEVAKKAKAEGVSVSLHVYEGMFHIFQKYKGFIPEADTAWKEVRTFVQTQIPETQK